jgi:CHAT domain-containing protein
MHRDQRPGANREGTVRIGPLKWVIIAAGLGAVVSGCETPPPSIFVSEARPATTSEAVPVGGNQVGEPCSFRPLTNGDVGGFSRRAAAVYCGNWQQPSGRIFELGDAGSAQLGTLAASGGWRNYLDSRFACAAPTDTRILDGAPALLMQCTRRTGGWPHLAIIASVGGQVFAADGIPSALPALEASVGALAGRPVAAGGAPQLSEAARLMARRSAGHPFGSGDLQRFYDLMAAGDAANNVDNPAQAEQAFREALAIQQRLLGPDNPGLALTMMKLAAQISHQRNAPEADRLLAQAAALAARSNDPLVMAQLDYYRAVTAAYQHKPREATKWAEAAEGAFTRLLPPGAGARAPTDLSLSSTPRSQGIDLALLTADNATTPTEQTAVLGLAETLRLRAALAARAGDGASSNALALRAGQLLRSTGLSVSSTGARSLRLVASNEAGVPDYSAAASYSSEAGGVFERVVPGERPQAVNMLRAGAYQLAQGRTNEALALFRRAGEILRRPGVVGATPEDVYPWIKALDNIAEARPEDRPQLTAEMLEAAQLAMGSRTALDIAQATARIAAGDPKTSAVIRDYQDKQGAFDSAQAERDVAVAERAPADRLAAIDARIQAAQKGRDEAEAAIRSAAPRYVEWSEKPVTEKELRERLGPDEAVVFFFVSGNGSYGFLVKPSGTRVYPIALNEAQLAAAITKLRDSAVERPGGLPEFDFAGAHALYAALFRPVEKELDGVSELSVAATGDLLRFPLAALVTQPGVSASNGDYRAVPWLVRRVALAYFPSPRVFVNVRQKVGAPVAPQPFIGFGDFRPPSQAQLAATFPPDRCREDFLASRALERLPQTKTEVTEIGQRLGVSPGNEILGEQFTKARVMGPDVGGRRIVLLASHALLPEDLKCQPGPSIVVSVPEKAPNAYGAFLTPGDIEKLKLDADLVVLSACNTGGPSAKTGEALSGLTRAFFRAGARGVMATYWPIVPGAAVPLMIDTFPTAGGALDTAQTLRQAQLKTIDSAGTGKSPIELSYPNYWAAFALIGDGVRTRQPVAGEM